MLKGNEVLTYDNTNPETTFDELAKDDRWLGFGYLGERQNQLADNRKDPLDADALALQSAIDEGLTYDELFEWANSKFGRWYGDCMFGSDGTHAEKYLPTRKLIRTITY